MNDNMTAFLAIGSNIDPLIHIPYCLSMLRKLSCLSMYIESSWYRTRPWGIESQPDFINLVVGLRTEISPLELLRKTQSIEASLGRTRIISNGPRTIDLDILLYGDCILNTTELRLPHPGLLIRDFMLIPLIEIAPDTLHPERGIAVSELVDEIRYRQIIALV